MFLAPRFLGQWYPGEAAAAISGLTAGAVASYLLYRFVRRVPWPRPFRFQFVLVHLVALLVFGVSWIGLSIAIETLFTGNPLETRTVWRLTALPHELPEISVLLYAIVVGIGYSVERRARVARIETDAVRAQLTALRAQLHPHFLFNALHAVVQLIRLDPARAEQAAELIASLLRTTLEEDRDEVTLDDEWTFVSRYLEVERIRFGDRLRISADVDRDFLQERVPSFALQTLVENAVRHGAADRVAPTEIVISAARTASQLSLSVRNMGDPKPPDSSKNGTGTGLSRLRERLKLLYGDGARLTCSAGEDGSFEAVLVVPRAKNVA
jgi:two-component system, LytTR family, sensor kinase